MFGASSELASVMEFGFNQSGTPNQDRPIRAIVEETGLLQVANRN